MKIQLFAFAPSIDMLVYEIKNAFIFSITFFRATFYV